MADKLTLLELHLHAEGNEFQSDMQLSSDIGDLLRRRLGLGSGSSEESERESATLGSESETASLGTESDLESETSSRPSVETPTDGGDTVQVDEIDESEGSGAVVEIDADDDLDTDEEDEDEESGGRSRGKTLLVLLLLVGFALLARKYLGGEEIEDEFEEL